MNLDGMENMQKKIQNSTSIIFKYIVKRAGLVAHLGLVMALSRFLLSGTNRWARNDNGTTVILVCLKTVHRLQQASIAR